MSEHRLQVTLNVVIGLLLVAADLAFVWCTKLTIDIATHVRTDVSLSVAVGALVAIVVVQLGLAISCVAGVMVCGLISGMTSGTPFSKRYCEDISTM